MIVAVVVTFAAPLATVQRCVDSVRDQVDRVVVVENGGRIEFDLKGADTIHTSNQGYGAAVNAGCRYAGPGADRFLILNDDVTVGEGAVEMLAAALDERGAAVAQPLLVNARDPAAIGSLGVAIGPDGAGTDIGAGQPAPDDRSIRQLEVFTGAAFLATATFWDATGGFDERYEMYYEDVDLARRGAELGFGYVLAPAAEVAHVGSLTSSAHADRTYLLLERNRLLSAVRFADPATIAGATWLSIRRLRHRPRRLHLRALTTAAVRAPRLLVERTVRRRHRRS